MKTWFLPLVMSLALGGAAVRAQDEGGPPKLSIKPAFEPNPARAGEVVTLKVEATVEPGWHVYGSKGNPATELVLIERGGLTEEGPARVPPGEEVKVTASYSTFDLKGTFQISQALRVPPGTPPGTVQVKGHVTFMACDENMCLPVDKVELTAELRVEEGAPRQDLTDAPPAGGGDRTGWLLLLLSAIGAGLITLVMPCTYPMIPITFSFFTKQAETRHGKVMSLALLYGLGIVLIFIVIGLAFGSVIGAFAAHWLTNLIFAVLFIVFAMALFGFITLQPPQFLMDAAAKASTTGGLLGVFLMGAAFVITSFTCTAPFVGTLLAGVSTEGHLRVGIAMAVFGITVALPFVLLALVPGKLKALPRSGEWMNTVKVYLGFVELAAALKFVSNVDIVLKAKLLPRELFFWLWAAIFLVAGLFVLGVFTKARPGRGRIITALLTFALAGYSAYGALGYPVDKYVMTPLAPDYSWKHIEPLHRVIEDDYESALKAARDENKLLLVNFTGHT